MWRIIRPCELTRRDGGGRQVLVQDLLLARVEGRRRRDEQGRAVGVVLARSELWRQGGAFPFHVARQEARMRANDEGARTSPAAVLDDRTFDRSARTTKPPDETVAIYGSSFDT